VVTGVLAHLPNGPIQKVPGSESADGHAYPDPARHEIRHAGISLTGRRWRRELQLTRRRSGNPDWNEEGGAMCASLFGYPAGERERLFLMAFCHFARALTGVHQAMEHPIEVLLAGEACLARHPGVPLALLPVHLAEHRDQLPGLVVE
jgi:hypothetical protein